MSLNLMPTVGNLADTACVTYSESHKVPPVMQAGKLTPAIVSQWHNYALLYFDKVKMVEGDRVAAVVSCFKDLRINNWVRMNREALRAGTFAGFLTELRRLFLDPQWKNALLKNIVNARMTSSESFSDFVRGHPIHVPILLSQMRARFNGDDGNSAPILPLQTRARFHTPILLPQMRAVCTKGVLLQK